ncbi:MAG: dihydropteroate synthase [Corynebacterium sp.]|nr:dihydropteroate synthase [Corynebacterium sp.]
MRPEIMGILNVTEDSFSDGGQFTNPAAAIAHAETLIADGATIIDIGGESTRPGAKRVTAEEECARVVATVEALKAHCADISTGTVKLSIDTMRASTARAALVAGADILNDVSGGLADPEMYAVAAEYGVPIILMHWRADTFGNAAGVAHSTETVTADVITGLTKVAEAAQAAGITKSNIILDPGLGFAKDAACNWTLIQDFQALASLGYPMLIGHSRKRFLQATLNQPSPVDADYATATLSAMLYARYGADDSLWGFRVHNVAATVSALRVVANMNNPEVANG